MLGRTLVNWPRPVRTWRARTRVGNAKGARVLSLNGRALADAREDVMDNEQHGVRVMYAGASLQIIPKLGSKLISGAIAPLRVCDTYSA